MKYLELFLVGFIGIIFSLAIAVHDFSEMQFGFVLNIMGVIFTVGIPLGIIIKIIKETKNG